MDLKVHWEKSKRIGEKLDNVGPKRLALQEVELEGIADDGGRSR